MNQQKPKSLIAEMLGIKTPENIHITERGNIVSSIGELSAKQVVEAFIRIKG